MKQINDYDEYKNEIALWVTGYTTGSWMSETNALSECESLSSRNFFTAPFVFQDENTIHFNHDVAKECTRRLQLLDK